MRQGYDFSLPTFTSGLKLIVRSKNDRTLWSFMLSFDNFLWGMIVITTIITGLITWLFED